MIDGISFTMLQACILSIRYHSSKKTLSSHLSCNLLRSGKMKVPEWVDLVKTNNRCVVKYGAFFLVYNIYVSGRSWPLMMRIGSMSVLHPWPATCTSGMAFFIVPCVRNAPYRSQTEPCVLLGHNVGKSTFL